MTSHTKMRFFIQPLTAFIRPVWEKGPIAAEYYARGATTGTDVMQVLPRPGEPRLPADYRTTRRHDGIKLADAIEDLRFTCSLREQINLLTCLSLDEHGMLRLRTIAVGDGTASEFRTAYPQEFSYATGDDHIPRLHGEEREAAIQKFVADHVVGYGQNSRDEREAAYVAESPLREVSLCEAISAIRQGYASQSNRDIAVQSIFGISCGYAPARRRPLAARLTRVINVREPIHQNYWGYKAWLSQLQAGRAIGADVTDLINRAREGDYIDASELVDIADRLNTAFGGRTDSVMGRIQTSLTKHGCDFETVVRADCGHWCTDDDTSLVHPNRLLWCPTCADEDARTPADQPRQLWDVGHLHLHDDDEYRTYEQEEEPYDDEDDVSGERTSFGDPERLLNYNVNPLDFVAKDESFTPSPSGDLLMGVELELILPGRQGKYIPDLRDQLDKAYAVFKADGSLDDFGAELVTAPRKLADHIERFTAVSFPSGSTAWDAGCCGMHVHIDSRGFTAMSLGKFVQFINDDANADLIRRIAGRHPNKDAQANNYCASIDQGDVVNPARAKGGYPNRYRMVNLMGLHGSEADRLGVSGVDGKYNTVELRIFRASLRKARLLAQLEFTHAAVMFCRIESYRNLKSSNFLAYLGKNHFLYPNLAKWLRVVTPKPTAQRPEVRPLSVDTAHDV